MRRAAVAWLVAGILLALAACSGSGSGEEAETTGWTRLSPTQLDQKLVAEDVFLVNVHVPYEGEIPGTDAFIPYTQLASRADELPGDESTLFLYCRSGSMSTDAAQDLVAAGRKGFFELDGGFNAWRAADLPFEVDPAGE
jgi:rhodanese-related sulfurtransferase